MGCSNGTPYRPGWLSHFPIPPQAIHAFDRLFTSQTYKPSCLVHISSNGTYICTTFYNPLPRKQAASNENPREGRVLVREGMEDRTRAVAGVPGFGIPGACYPAPRGRTSRRPGRLTARRRACRPDSRRWRGRARPWGSRRRRRSSRTRCPRRRAPRWACARRPSAPGCRRSRAGRQ